VVAAIGAHVSVAGGLLNAVPNARAANCEAFQVWVSSARAWKPPTLDPAVDDRFREQVADAGLGPVFVHAAYLVNLASTSQATFDSSVAAVGATLDKAAAIGAAGVVVHAGSHLGAGRAAGLARIRQGVLPLLERLGRRPDAPDLLFELTAGTRNAIASRFEEMAELVDTLGGHPKLRVCVDTCHAHAAGYDLADPVTAAAAADELAELLGGRLALMHANDSLDPAGAARDRHCPIGGGTIGEDGFAALLAHPGLAGLPVVTETTGDRVQIARDVACLRRLRDAARRGRRPQTSPGRSSVS
jgi:deoxyribonuclease-4